MRYKIIYDVSSCKLESIISGGSQSPLLGVSVPNKPSAAYEDAAIIVDPCIAPHVSCEAS